MIIHKLQGDCRTKLYIPCGQDPKKIMMFYTRMKFEKNPYFRLEKDKEMMTRRWGWVNCEKCLKGTN